MEGALAWIGHLVEWFGQFFPRWVIIDTTQGGVKFVRGSRVVKLGPGIHFYWPLTTTLSLYPTARQANDLRPQVIVTKDGKTALIGGLIVYEIEDVEKLLAYTFDADDTVRDIALAAIHDVVTQYEWEELRHAANDARRLSRELLTKAQQGLADYGVRVLRVTVTDLAPAHVLRLVGESPREGGVR